MKLIFGYLFPVFLVFISCSPKHDEEKIKEDFVVQFNEFYKLYGSNSTEFVDYYAEDVITMDDKGKVTVGREEYRESWAGVLARYEIDLLEFTAPEILFSPGQIVSYNDYDEYFISKETGDSIRGRGTWIAVWQRKGNKWRVKMNTYHLKE
jgi:ketosteroid isomerase-like protein